MSDTALEKSPAGWRSGSARPDRAADDGDRQVAGEVDRPPVAGPRRHRGRPDAPRDRAEDLEQRQMAATAIAPAPTNRTSVEGAGDVGDGTRGQAPEVSVGAARRTRSAGRRSSPRRTDQVPGPDEGQRRLAPKSAAIRPGTRWRSLLSPSGREQENPAAASDATRMARRLFRFSSAPPGAPPT